MIDRVFQSSYARARLRCPPLGFLLDDHVAYLFSQGYSLETVRSHITILRRFNTWLALHQFAATRFDEPLIQRYVRDLSPMYRTSNHLEPIRVLLHRLRELGVNRTRPPQPPQTYRDRLVRNYTDYLRDNCCYSEQTIVYYALYARRFLTWLSDQQRTSVSRLRARDIVAYVRQLPRKKGARLEAAVGSLRRFLRFLLQAEYLTTDLVVFVPAVARWQKSAMPRSLTQRELKQLLQCCDRRTMMGRRDYAVLMLLSRLGLRAGEVQRLTLDDVDWENGELTIRGKGRRRDVLPLPHDVGEAIVAYVKTDRPACQTRYIFVRFRAPFRPWAGASAVCSLVRRLFRKAGLAIPRSGPHLLRHTCATHLLQRGRTLKEIGQVLRHNHVDSTATYAKLNEGELRQAAGPWPEDQS